MTALTISLQRVQAVLRSTCTAQAAPLPSRTRTCLTLSASALSLVMTTMAASVWRVLSSSCGCSAISSSFMPVTLSSVIWSFSRPT